MERYNIYIVNKTTGDARTLYGKNIHSDKLYEKIVMCYRRINHLFEPIETKVGSEEDAKFSKDLINNK